MGDSVLFISRTHSTHDLRFLDALLDWGYEVSYAELLPSLALPPPPRRSAVRYWRHPIGVESPDDVVGALADFVPRFRAAGEPFILAGPVQTGGLLAASAEAPYAVFSWGSDMLVDAGRDARWTTATRDALRHADLAVCDCVTVLNKMFDYGLPETTPVAVFPWGTELSVFRPGPSDRSWPFETTGKPDDLVFLSLRTWEASYGILELLDGFRQAAESNAQIRLVLAGHGALAGDVSDFIVRNELERVVHRCGWIPRETLPGAMRSVSGYVSMAVQDGSSVSLMEAMASGLPVIVTDNSSNREWVEDRVHGFLTPTLDSAALSVNLLRIAALKPTEREGMANSCREVALRRADWGRNKELLRRQLELALRGWRK